MRFLTIPWERVRSFGGVANGSQGIRFRVLFVVLAVIAFGVRLLLVLRGGGLLGVGAYDDGVYYAAATAFVHGRMPYLDFLFLQPPGVVLAGAPFAGLGALTTDSTGFVAARLGFMAIGALNTVLVAAILRRFGFTAAAVGGFFYAVAYVAAYGERSILLEPVGTLGILVALLVLARPALRGRTGWLLVAGVALGVATGFKIWYIVPAAVIIAWSGRAWGRMLLGAVAGGCAIYLPFLVADPAASFREIVLDQLGRAGAAPSLGARVHMILGDYAVPPLLAKAGLNTAGLTIVMALVAAAAVVVALTVRDARLFVVLFVVDAAVLLAAPSFFLHYTALTSPMMSLVFGVAVGRAAALVHAHGARIAVAGGIAVLLVVANAPLVLRGAQEASVQVGMLRAQAERVSGCITADDPTLLAVADVLTRDLDARCPLWPDVTGYTYGPDREVAAGGRWMPRADNARWQRAVMEYLTSGSAVILSRSATGLDADSHRMIVRGELLDRQRALLFVRTPVRES